ncbi:signal peptidase II [Mucilaginibacter segetis]|uniref:Lipoprotein signal peptidase n=1 Tax=Mucilaginibacter segetis TaxID=2793071 RepID=A0A934UP31_9SPHI|nr:signal peptidase II [Mucilaginibacter segetis]MBK0380557.1 signal peptidase II [Mucilaginibacter segetis]
MKVKGIYRAVIILFILAVNVGCDQVSKKIVRARLDVYDHYSFLDHHFNLMKVENPGAFLSLGDKLVNPYRFILLTLIPVLALLGAVVYILVKNNFSKTRLAGIICVIGGGIGNIYDRVVHGSVTDFMHIQFGSLQTGIFNVADVSIMVGMGLIILDTFLRSKNDVHPQQEFTTEPE